MSAAEFPIGKPESQTLEFKGRDATPAKIAREVVAMLNAPLEGEVWVGIGEERGNAIALEPLGDPAGTRDRLWDHFVETLEPSPDSSEVSIDLVGDDRVGFVFRIRIAGRRRPYAQLENGGRHYLVREGPRLRPMTREEILEGEAEGEGPGAAIQRLLELRSSAPSESLWMAAVPQPAFSVDAQDARVRELMSDPGLSGCRSGGWNVMHPRAPQPELVSESMAIEHARGRGLRVHSRDCAIEFRTPLDSLFHGRETVAMIYPYPLMELPTSMLRMTARFIASFAPRQTTSVLFDAALFDVSAWKLRPYSPKSAVHLTFAPRQAKADDLLRQRPFEFDAAELVENPDACGFSVVRWLYERFGMSEEEIPFEFDLATRRLKFD